MQLAAQSDFNASLAYGEDGERKIARFLIWRGRSVLPVYEKTGAEWKGPRFHAPGRQLIAPDLFVLNGVKMFWVEAKRKSVFSWYRIGQVWETGIDKHCWNDYLALAKLHPIPVWLFFLHEREETPEGDGHSPTGLFGNDIEFLKDNISHESGKWGKSGMVYWAVESLKRIATLQQIEEACLAVNF
jgi:hypothetical protein